MNRTVPSGLYVAHLAQGPALCRWKKSHPEKNPTLKGGMEGGLSFKKKLVGQSPICDYTLLIETKKKVSTGYYRASPVAQLAMRETRV